MTDPARETLAFAETSRYRIQRDEIRWHLSVAAFDETSFADVTPTLTASGLRFTSLADEPADAGERRLYDLARRVYPDFPNPTNRPLADFATWLAKRLNVPRLMTDNDTYNTPIIELNQRLGYVPVRRDYTLVKP